MNIITGFKEISRLRCSANGFDQLLPPTSASPASSPSPPSLSTFYTSFSSALLYSGLGESWAQEAEFREGGRPWCPVLWHLKCVKAGGACLCYLQPKSLVQEENIMSYASKAGQLMMINHYRAIPLTSQITEIWYGECEPHETTTPTCTRTITVWVPGEHWWGWPGLLMQLIAFIILMISLTGIICTF